MIVGQTANRRAFLRAWGVTLTLPWLESLGPRTLRAAPEPTEPSRYVFIYTPNGYCQKTFTPTTTGRDWELTPALEPLAALRERVTLITGLDRQFVPGTGVHAQAGSCWLTSSPPQETKDGGFPTNITLDQILARQLGQQTMLPSLELSCNDFADNKETKYFESISWYGPGYAANVQKNPRAVFKRLFGKADAAERSILDAVKSDARVLHSQLGKADRVKFDEYLTSVREVERRIELAASANRDPARLAAAIEDSPALSELSKSAGTGIPADRGAYLRLMGELIVLALQNDLTRVVTLVIDPERWDSPRMYHGVFDKPMNHHVLTHTKGDEAKAALTKIDRFHVEFFAALTKQLSTVRSGQHALLDSTCVAMGSGISDGDSHNYRDLQVLLAGTVPGLRGTGQHLHYQGHRPLADLWLTLAQGAGVKLPRFADSTGVLKELAG